MSLNQETQTIIVAVAMFRYLSLVDQQPSNACACGASAHFATGHARTITAEPQAAITTAYAIVAGCPMKTQTTAVRKHHQ